MSTDSTLQDEITKRKIEELRNTALPEFVNKIYKAQSLLDRINDLDRKSKTLKKENGAGWNRHSLVLSSEERERFCLDYEMLGLLLEIEKMVL